MPSTNDLIGYAAVVHQNVRDAGIVVNIGTSAAPNLVDVASDVDGRSLVSGCVQMIGLAAQLSLPTPAFPWTNDDLSQQSLTPAQMYAIAQALYDYVQNTYAALQAVAAMIKAGTITTLAGVGDPSHWPSTSVTAPTAS